MAVPSESIWSGRGPPDLPQQRIQVSDRRVWIEGTRAHAHVMVGKVLVAHPTPLVRARAANVLAAIIFWVAGLALRTRLGGEGKKAPHQTGIGAWFKEPAILDPPGNDGTWCRVMRRVRTHGRRRQTLFVKAQRTVAGGQRSQTPSHGFGTQRHFRESTINDTNKRTNQKSQPQPQNIPAIH